MKCVSLDILQSLHQADPNPAQPSLVKEVIAIYLQTSPGIVEKIEKAILAHDAVTVSKQAHTLKSSSASVGGLDFSELCKKMEEAGKISDMATASSLLQDFKSAFQQLMAELPRAAKSF